MRALRKQPFQTSQLVTDTVAASSDGVETVGSDTASERGWGASPESAPRAGAMLGRYVILDQLGAGGMGEVFAARDTELDRDVALKLISSHRYASESTAYRECLRLRAEAQALARLSHPNVVQIYEVGNHFGRTFLAMELVDGPTLSAWSSQSLAETIQVYAQAGRGLAAAHAAGLVHRDFKPSNVLIGSDGRVRVVDFGLAVTKQLAHEAASTIGDESHDLDAEGSAGARARSGSLAGPGTLPYMAPEQAFIGAGAAAGDQFSFCVALFEAVYGARPFPAVGVMELLYKLDTCTIEYPAEAPKVPRWLRRLLQRGLARRPEDRFESMDALVTDLTRDRRRSWRRAAFAAVVAGLTALTVLALSPAHDPGVSASPPEPTLDGVWDGSRRAELGQAFDRSSSPWAEASEATVVAGLDHWSQRWLSEARGANELQNPLAHAAVRACLDSQRVHTNVTIEALLDGDPVLLEGAVVAVDALPEPSRCAAASRLARAHELGLASPGPELLQTKLRELADAAAQRGLGNFELAHAGADAVVGQAQARGWVGVELAALRQRGLAALGSGRREAGLADLERARALAVRGADRRTEAELWVELAWAGRKLDNLELRRDRLGLARAHVDALLDAPASRQADRHARLLDARLRLATALDLLEPPSSSSGSAAIGEAESLLLEGLGQLEGMDAGDSSLAIDYLHALAGARDRAGLFDQAESDYRRAIARAEQVRGPDHPTNARLWHDAGALAHERGDLELARERLERATHIRRSALRIDHPELARSEQALAALKFGARDYAAAKHHAELALRSLERSTTDHDALPETLRLLGQLEAREAHWEVAVRHYERARSLMSERGIQRSLTELELGKALAALGQHERALELMDAALPTIAARLGPARCHQMIPSYERHAASSSSLGREAQASASLEAALACSQETKTRVRLEAALEQRGR